MAQYIDKSALVAEIKKTEKLSKDKAKNAVDTYFKIHFDGWATACRSILSYLDTLEVKEVDIRSEVSNWWNSHYAGVKQGYTFEGYSGHYMDNSTIVNLAQYFYELGLKSQQS